MNKLYVKIFLIVVICINIVFSILFIYFFCGNIDLSLNQKRKCNKIGLSYMTMNNEFYKILNEEIFAKAEAEGDILILRDPALDEKRQLKQINEMLDEKIDVLVVTPVNWKTLSQVLERAKKENVKVIVVDSDVYDKNMIDCTIKSDNYDAGVQIAKYVLKDNKKRRFVLMTHNEAKSGIDRIQGFKDTVKEHKNIDIVAELECEGQLEIAEPEMRKFIKSGKGFDAVFCLNDLASVGVVAALEANDILDDVEIYGVDASPDSKALIKENIMKASSAQFPSKIGKSTANAIYDILQGKKTEKQILVPVELINNDNIEKYGVDRWQ